MMSFVPGSQMSVLLKVNWINLIEIAMFERVTCIRLPLYRKG